MFALEMDIRNTLRRISTKSIPTNEEEEASSLAQILNHFAAAWASGNRALMSQNYSEDGPAMRNFAAQIHALKRRIERELVARSVEAPELNQPPYLDQDPAAAIDSLADELFKRGDWRRLLKVSEANPFTQPPRYSYGATGVVDLAAALRSLLSGENFEKAEQWSDAVASYKNVLRATDARAPVSAAADRLKDLKAKHPDAFTTPDPSPGPSKP